MPSHDLNAMEGAALLARLEAEPHRFTLFAALRLIEQAFAAQPRLGESRKASDDAVRLGQVAHLSFAPCDVAEAGTTADGRFSLGQYAFGVFGPNGALPLHLTELAYDLRRQKEDPTIVDFVNLFQHRLISLFYRAWAEAEPAVSGDRPASDRFRTYVGALIGLTPDASSDAHPAETVCDDAMLSRAGLFAAQTCSADGLENVLADYFGVPVEIRQFVGAWLEIPADLRCRLGRPDAATLGVNATLGEATWQCQHQFEIVLGPLSRTAFVDFLPGARGLDALTALVRFYTNDEWAWQLRLRLQDVEIPGIALGAGASPLGWMSWLGMRRGAPAEVVVQAPARPAPGATVGGAPAHPTGPIDRYSPGLRLGGDAGLNQHDGYQ